MVQSISAISLMIWAGISTLFLIWFVDKILPIRLSPEDELKGCDITDLFLGEDTGTVARKSIATLDKIISIASPIARRFSATNSDGKHQKDDFGRRKIFHVNEAFERRESIKVE